MAKPGKGKANTSAQGAQTTTTPASSSSSSPPNWPAFKPPLPLPGLSLELESLVEDQIVVVRNFWPRSLCRDYVSFLKTLPLVTTPGKPKKGDAVRVNDRFEINDARFADRLWSQTGLKDVVLQDEDARRLWGGEPVGLNPRIRVYRYSKGQYFAAHCKQPNLSAIEPP